MEPVQLERNQKVDTNSREIKQKPSNLYCARKWNEKCEHGTPKMPSDVPRLHTYGLHTISLTHRIGKEKENREKKNLLHMIRECSKQ